MGRGGSQYPLAAPETTLSGRFRGSARPDIRGPITIDLGSTAALDYYRECFVDGYTDDIFADLLPKLGHRLDLKLIAIWEGRDAVGFHGEMEVFVADGLNRLRDLPDCLHDWMFSIDPKPLPRCITVRRAPRRTKDLSWQEFAPANGLASDVRDYRLANIPAY